MVMTIIMIVTVWLAAVLCLTTSMITGVLRMTPHTPPPPGIEFRGPSVGWDDERSNYFNPNILWRPGRTIELAEQTHPFASMHEVRHRMSTGEFYIPHRVAGTHPGPY